MKWHDFFRFVTNPFVLGKSNYIPKYLQLKEFILSFYYNFHDIFDHIELETTTICNRFCPYCPHGYIRREKAFMKAKLFKNIIDQLREDFNFKGHLHLHRFGEPLLDRRLPKLVSYARKKLPSVNIYIYTNGDFITKQKFKKLLRSGVNLFFITQHTSYKNGVYITDMSENLKHFLLSLTEKQKTKIRFNSITPGDVLANRHGIFKVQNKRHPITCSMATRMLEIDYKGRILLCCQQYNEKDGPVLGDLRKNTLKEIWNKPYYKKLRADLRHGKFKFDICKKCAWRIWNP